MRSINLFGRKHRQVPSQQATPPSVDPQAAARLERLTAAAAAFIAEHDLPLAPDDLIGRGVEARSDSVTLRFFLEDVGGTIRPTCKQYYNGEGMSVDVTADGRDDSMSLADFVTSLRIAAAAPAPARHYVPRPASSGESMGADLSV
jgi:hypothetical protein